MALTALTPMLRTADIPGTIGFYTSVLGFDCESYNQALGWASLRHGPIRLMISGLNTHEGDQAPIFTGSFYFTVDDVDALWNQLKEGAKVCYELETFDYGMREFAIYDNNGYLLQFGQEVLLD